jgi:flagellar biosynthesis protein FlhF
VRGAAGAALGARRAAPVKALMAPALAAGVGARPPALGGFGPATAVLEPPPGKALLQTPAASNILIAELTRQLEDVKSMVKEVAVQVQVQQAPHVPEELSELYVELTARQVCPQLASDLLRSLHRALRPEHLARADFVREKLAEQIERLLATTGPIARCKRAGPHVVALIGPTGVGKTTTIAKLAANLHLREQHHVGLITIDTYRIAAIDQLKRYADIIGAPLRVVACADELGAAVETMKDCSFILIDTAGRSPNDKLKLSELRNFIHCAHADEVHLVLSATSSQDCLEDAVKQFGGVRLDKIIFTKLDETRKLGGVLNIVRKVNKPVSYVTTGQDVPDDIEVARGPRLAQLILGSEL